MKILFTKSQIMHLHKGEINIESEENKGTVISLLF